MLLDLELHQSGFEHLHGVVAVLELRALRLAGGDDARGLVDESNGRACLVDVLAACAGGAVDLHLDVLGADLDLNVLGQLGHDLKRCEARLAAGVGVKRGNAHQAVHAVLAL